MPGTPVRYTLKFTITLFLYFFSGCELTEPDRFINDKAYPPEVKSLVFDKIVEGQRISGEFTLELDSSTIDFKVSRAELVIENKYHSESYSPDYKTLKFKFNTRDFGFGEHDLIIRLYQNVKPHGLLNLLNPPTLVLVKKIFIDNSPPKGVKLDTVTINNSGDIVLRWSKSISQNFVAYVVCMKTWNTGGFKALDTIYNVSDTTFTESKSGKIVGVSYYYMIVEYADFNLSKPAYSNTEEILYRRQGVPEGSIPDFIYPAKKPKRPEFYLLR